MVVQAAQVAGRSIRPNTPHPPIDDQVVQDERSCTPGDVHVVDPPQPDACVGERGDGKAVPRGHDFLVARGRRTSRACGVQLAEGGCQQQARIRADPLGDHLQRSRNLQDVRALEVALGAHPVAQHDGLGLVSVQHLGELLHRPHEERTLPAGRVGVLRRGEAAAGRLHLAQQVVKRALGHLAPAPLTSHAMGQRVDTCQQGVVVEHFLEVRHQPDRIDAVAMEATSDLVMDPAVGHAVQRGLDHLLRVVVFRVGPQSPQQELERKVRGELGRAPEPALARVERHREAGHSIVDRAPVQFVGGRCPVGRRGQALVQLARRMQHVVLA